MQLFERAAERLANGFDVALGAVMAAALAFDAARASRASSEWPYVLGFGVAVCVIALLRSRSRVWTTVAGLAAVGMAAGVSALWVVTPSQVEVAPILALTVLAASQARWLPARQAVVISGFGALVVAGAESSHAGGSFDPRALFALFGTVVWGGAVAVGVWLRYLDHRQAATLEAVRRDERLVLARELHDVVAHHVTGIVVQAQAARFAGQGQPGPVGDAFASIEAAGLDTLAAIRRLVGLLRDPEDTAGVASGPEPLDQLVERFGRHGPLVDLQLPADLTSASWPPEVASTLYRIVQEALTNVARHAPEARSVTVSVTRDSRQVIVEVADDAPPVPARPSRVQSGYGLIGMRERVEALGGRLSAGPLANQGWAVKASLPVAAQSGP